MNISKKSFFGCSFLFIAFCIGMFIFFGRRHALNEAQLKLTGWNRMQASALHEEFKQYKSELLIFAENYTVLDAYKAFLAAWNKLEEEITAEQATQITKELEIFYTTVWLKRLKTLKQDVGDAQLYIPATKAGKWLQLHYIVKNPYPHEEKEKLITPPGVENDYTRAHTKYHALLHHMKKMFNIADFVMVDHKTGNVIYNEGKEVNLGQNLYTGVFKDNNESKAFTAAATTQINNFTKLVNFAAYEPNFGAPEAFMSTPLEEGTKKIGVLLIQIDTSSIDKVTTVGGEWEDYGMGKTGELLVIGQDLLLLAKVRQFVQHPEEFYKNQARNGMPVQKVQQIRAYNSPLLIYKFPGSKYAPLVRGDAGVTQVSGFYSDNNLAVYRPIQIPDVTWAMVAMQTLEEIYAPVYKTALWFAGSLILFIFLLFLIITIFRTLRKNSTELGKNNEDSQIQPQE